eukprot:scaffold11017_cov65-Skeletonema_dohrnii-CCMP3373.AAC.1
MSNLGKQDLVAVGSIDKHDRIVFFAPMSGCVAAMYTSRGSVQAVASCCDKLQAEKLRLEEERMRKLQAEKLILEETTRQLVCGDVMSKMLDQITMTAAAESKSIAEPKSIAFEEAASLQLCGVAASTPIPDSSSSSVST